MMTRAIRYDVRGNNGLAEYPGPPDAPRNGTTADIIERCKNVIAATSRHLPRRADAASRGQYDESDLDAPLDSIQAHAEGLLGEVAKVQLIRRAKDLAANSGPAVLDGRSVQRSDAEDFDPCERLQRRISAGQHVRHDTTASVPVTKADGDDSDNDYDPAERLQRRIHTAR